MRHVVAAILILLSIPALALAGTPAPEIDLSAAPAGLVLLGGALVVLRSRRKS